MSSLKNARINAYIEQNLAGIIDLSSVVEQGRPTALLTRGIAALAVIRLQDAVIRRRRIQ